MCLIAQGEKDRCDVSHGRIRSGIANTMDDDNRNMWARHVSHCRRREFANKEQLGPAVQVASIHVARANRFPSHFLHAGGRRILDPQIILVGASTAHKSYLHNPR